MRNPDVCFEYDPGSMYPPQPSSAHLVAFCISSDMNSELEFGSGE